MFHASAANEVLFGGAAGGGKSKAIVMDAFLRCLRWPNTSAYIFRRTYTELDDTIITEAKRSLPASLVTYNVSRHEMILPNGSKINFRHCASVGDMYNYSGAEIHWLYFDELTTFEQKIYDFLKTRLRAKKSLGIIPIVRSSSNPGSIGHGWVKKMFVTAGPYNEIIPHEIPETQDGIVEHYTTHYIPSLATENPYISKEYLKELRKKPKALRDALLYGHWDAFEGQVFTEFVNDSEHYLDGLYTHVILPFPIPDSWAHYRSFDWGKSHPFSVGWWAISPAGIFYRYREWYGCNGTANVGLGYTAGQVAQGIYEIEKEERDRGISFDGLADPHIYDVNGGESVAQLMQKENVHFRASDNSRIAGKMQLHEKLRFDSEGRPGLYVFDNCKDFIRTIPEVPYSLKKVEDVDSDSEDHCLIGKTLVWTDKGRVAIQDLAGTSGMVYSHDGQLHAYADCRKTQFNVLVFTIELEDGTQITATKNHRFMLSDGTWKRLDEIQSGDDLFCVKE